MASESSKSALRGFGDRIDKADQGLHPLPEIRICQEGFLALFCVIKNRERCVPGFSILGRHPSSSADFSRSWFRRPLPQRHLLKVRKLYLKSPVLGCAVCPMLLVDDKLDTAAIPKLRRSIQLSG